MNIGELAKRVGCKTETIRYYEKEGLLPKTKRGDNNYREYDEVHLNRLHLIINCRSLEMNLDEIRELLMNIEDPEANCEKIDQLLDAHILHVTLRLKELESLRSMLLELHAACSSPNKISECKILNQMNRLEFSKTKSTSHV